MSKCEFYKTEATTLRPHTQRADRREPPPKRVIVPFCTQPTDSPVSRAKALAAAGTRLLACGGDLAVCPIADKLKG